MAHIKAETVPRWQMKIQWALSALLWHSVMMTNWFINQTWFPTMSSAVNLIEVFSFSADFQHVSVGHFIFTPMWKLFVYKGRTIMIFISGRKLSCHELRCGPITRMWRLGWSNNFVWNLDHTVWIKMDFNSRLFTKTLHWFKMITFMCAADCLIPK